MNRISAHFAESTKIPSYVLNTVQDEMEALCSKINTCIRQLAEFDTALADLRGQTTTVEYLNSDSVGAMKRRKEELLQEWKGKKAETTQSLQMKLGDVEEIVQEIVTKLNNVLISVHSALIKEHMPLLELGITKKLLNAKTSLESFIALQNEETLPVASKPRGKGAMLFEDPYLALFFERSFRRNFDQIRLACIKIDFEILLHKLFKSRDLQ